MNVVMFASEPQLYGSPYNGPWVTDCSPAEVQRCYSDWEPEVEELLKVTLERFCSLTWRR